MLSGSGGHNSMIYLRGNDRDYNTWRRMGNPTWEWQNVLRYFKKSEGNQNADFVRDQLYHSGRGKLLVSSYNDTGTLGDVFIAAGVESGYKHVKDLNAGKYLGYAYAQGTLANGRRQSTAKTFLTPASRRPNLHVFKNAVVSKILIEDGEAAGVRFTCNGTKFVARNRKDVILSAGTISSPQILQLSGIGPREHLKRIGIPVEKNLAVGENLHDHTSVTLFFAVKPSDPGVNPQEQLLKSFYQLVVNNSGPLTGIDMSNLNALINTKRDGPYPDVQLAFEHFDANTTDFDTFLTLFNLSDPTKSALVAQNLENDIVILVCSLLKPKSRGTITLNTHSIADPPKIDLNWLDENDDIETLVRAVRQQVDLVNTIAYKKRGVKYLQPILPACDCLLDMDDYYRCYVSQLTVTIFHPVGTCKMGPRKDPQAVVDYRLRVRGIEKLRVIDASIMPLIPSANTNAATIMVAEKGSDFIKFDWSRLNAEYD